jgi:hypothetical protein
MRKLSDYTVSTGEYPNITAAANIGPTHLNFGNIKIHCDTGEVSGLSENISDDAKFFWEQVKEYIIGK